MEFRGKGWNSRLKHQGGRRGKQEGDRMGNETWCRRKNLRGEKQRENVSTKTSKSNREPIWRKGTREKKKNRKRATRKSTKERARARAEHSE